MYNDEGASETFCLSECCAPGCIICFGGEEKTGLPNVTSSVETLLCVALLVATGLSIFFYEGWQVEAVSGKRTLSVAVLGCFFSSK